MIEKLTLFEKIDLLIEEKKKFLKDIAGYPYLIDIRANENQWTSQELNKLKTDYAWLPPFYFDFIERYDSLGLGWAVFFGSEKANVITIWEEIDYWQENMRDQYFPVAKDADGSIFVLNRQGETYLMHKHDMDWENPEYIAESLEHFIEDCLIGKRYAEFNKIEKETFYSFLEKQGWTK